MNQPPPLLTTEAGRQRALLFALALTRDTPMAPDPKEQALLDQFVRGELALDEVLTLLETPAPTNEARQGK